LFISFSKPPHFWGGFEICTNLVTAIEPKGIKTGIDYLPNKTLLGM